MSRSFWNQAALAVGQSVLIAVLLFVFLRGWDRDFRVPINFAMDSLVAEMQSKSTVDNGWWWFNPRIGAPFGLDELQFPANSNVDQAVVWSVSRVVHDPATAINLSWLVMVLLSGLTATWCLGQLGISRMNALVAGTLFALTPYAFYRNLEHLWMVIYLVPFACTAALLLASGRVDRWFWGLSRVPVLAGCALLGLNYVYTAFFGAFLLAVAAVVGWLQHRAPRLLGAGVVAIALIGAGTLVNLAPSLYSWHERGRPLILHDKLPGESETFGLKIRQLVSPSLWHRFPPFRDWLAREQAAAFPVESENTTARLGVVGTVGFLGLLVLLFAPRLGERLARRDELLAASRLTLAAVLLATVGGFGSLVALLITPEIRAYTRISPFIAFFSLAAVAFVLGALVRIPWRRAVLALVVLLVGLADQRAAAVNLNAIHKGVAAEVASLRTFVGGLEARLPEGAMVMQLPLRTYLTYNDPGRMRPFDHVKLYLLSHSLRWSYPALSNQQVRWQQAAATLPLHELPRQLAAEGFSAIVLDRYGYADNGEAAVGALRAQADHLDVLGETERYLALDIRRVAPGAPRGFVLARAAGTLPVSTGLPACVGQTLMHIDRVGVTNAPFAEPPRVARSGDVRVSGWAVDQGVTGAAAGVDVLLDRAPFLSIYGMDRPDVAAQYGPPAYAQSGFLAAVRAAGLSPGAHTLTLRIAAADGHCYYETLPLSVVVD